MASHNFIHLHVHSAYSLAEGAIRIKDLLKSCVRERIPAVAVTDTNNMFGAMEFALEAAKKGVQPILGAQVSYGPENAQILLLVQSEEGYRNLCHLLSDSYMNESHEGFEALTPEALKPCAAGLICLSGGAKGPLARALLHHQKDKAEAELLTLKEIFGDRFYIELQRHGLDEEDKTEEALIDLAYAYEIPLVATNDCYFMERAAHEAHDALLCISEGRYVTEEDRRKVTPEHYFKSAEEMAELFADLPEAIDNTALIARRCAYLLRSIDPLLPTFAGEGGRGEEEELKTQALEGLKWRLENFVFSKSPQDNPPSLEGGGKGEGDNGTLPHDSTPPHPNPLPEGRGGNFDGEEEISKPYFDRLNYELEIITQMGFPGYFLIVSDFIKWAKEQNIPVGPGRGSGAGSVVAWALQITDLDPLELNLLFERFLNPERVSMPDFDIDFCQERRDEVIHYVQNKYGHDHVAQIITFGKLQARAVVRDVGRVLQMPYGQVDRIAKMIPNNPAAPITLAEALAADKDLRAERDKDDTNKKLINIALQLEGLYRHASTHAAGLVIGDRPLHELVPLYRDPRSDMPVTQFNMKYIEQTGLVKFDFLGLKTMTVIQKSVDLIRKSTGEEINILQVPFDDETTFQMLRRGDNTGVFQLESAGMRDLGKQMELSSFEQIIALVALYRPGPMENIPKYLACLHGREERDYMHEKLKPYLEETYGIMIYQEQVMQAAQVLAGYSLGAADLLRRAMGKKIKSEMDAQRALFVKGARETSGVEEDQANHIFDQIAKFAGYGFNKAHSAGYALIAYWTAYLKANYPVEFMAASMTLDKGNTDKLSIFKQDLDYMGIPLLLPDINKSYPEFGVELSTLSLNPSPSREREGRAARTQGEGDKAIRYALAALKGVGEHAMEEIVREREQNGPFQSLEDFASRINPKAMNKRQFEQLASAGAFECLGIHRAQIHSAAEIILRYAQSLEAERSSGQVNLFGGENGAGALAMPSLPDVPKWDPLEQLAHEFGAVGFYLSAHPLDTRMGQLERMKISSYTEMMKDLENKQAVRKNIAGVLLKKQEKISQKGSKYAFLQLSDPTGVFEVVIFSELLGAARDFLEPGTTLLLSVDAEMREEQLRITAHSIDPLDAALEEKIMQIHIVLSNEKPLRKLKEFMDSQGNGKSKIMLLVHTNDNRCVELEIPGRWSLSSEARNILRTQDGVLRVAEI